MPHSKNRSTLKRSLGISTALHLLLAPLLVGSATLALGQAAAREPGETESTRVSYLRLEHRRVPQRRRTAVMRVAVATQPAVERPRTWAHVTPPHVNAVAPARRTSRAEVEETRPATHGRRSATAPKAASEAAAVTVAERAGPPEPATFKGAQAADPVPVTTPAPTPAPARVEEASARGVDVPAGGWGQSFDKPLVADEAALADLRTRYHAASAATIEVDEAGHATRVVLPAGLSDEARAELEKRLRELRYVPAECNGLRCGGTLQVLI